MFDITLSDSYKYSHWNQYPPKTQHVYSYLESRGGEFDELVVFGLQYYLKKYLEGTPLTQEGINRTGSLIDAHMGPNIFNWEGFNKLLEKHKGALPIKIWSLREGSVVQPRTPILAMENTDPEFFWLTNFLETLLVKVWYPITVASNSYRCRKMIKNFLWETCDAEGENFANILNFRLHDFGMRGVSSSETGAIGAAAHLINFLGTDTVSGMVLLEDYYHAPTPCGYSIIASEHSTMTSWGGSEGEVLAMKNMLDKNPSGLIACVSDSYDIKDAIQNKWGGKLKDQVLSRDGTLVVRPDSGDPVYTTGWIVKELWEIFGGHVNKKGYRVLDPHIRMIQGDGIDFETLTQILQNFQKLGFSAENIAFGSGGGLLQKWNRDSAKIAFKCSEITVDGETRDVRKFPKEFDKHGSYTTSNKFSKKGRFPELELVFKNGKLIKDLTLDEVKKY